MKKKVAVGLVCFREIERYLDEYIESMKNQTYKDFDLLVIEDCFDSNAIESLNKTKNLGFNVVIKKINHKMSIAQIRVDLIKWSIELGYEWLIFSDGDDTFSKNRISEIVDSYESGYDFYYNSLYTQEGKDFYEGKIPSITQNIEDIIDYNYIGLGHSAIYLGHISRDILKLNLESQILAFDWYFYSYLLLKGYKGKLVEAAKTYYRIYDSNFAGDQNRLDEVLLERGMMVKSRHYEAFDRAEFHLKKSEIKEFAKYMQDIKRRTSYIECANSMSYYFWWENIADKKALEQMEAENEI